MAYQGNSPAANFQSLPAVQRFNGTGSATAFTLASVIPNDQSILVSVDGVTQDSNAYSVSGTTLTFTAAPSSGTGNIFVHTISPVGSTVVPPDGSVSTVKLVDGAVTQAKVAGEAINESKLQVSNSPTNGYFLSAQSGNTGGLTWAEASAGTILQTVSVLTTTQASQTITTSDTQLGLLTKAITPLGANSKFLVYVRWFGEVHSSWNVCFNIQMNGTRVNINSGGRGYALAMPLVTYGVQADDNSTPENANFQTLVSTSSVIGTAITFRAVVDANVSTTLWNNRCFATTSANYERGTSELIITEVAA